MPNFRKFSAQFSTKTFFLGEQVHHAFLLCFPAETKGGTFSRNKFRGSENNERTLNETPTTKEHNVIPPFISLSLSYFA